MNCRARFYESYEEALSEWHHWGLPTVASSPLDLAGTIITYVEGARPEELEKFQELVLGLGGKAFRCDTTVTRLVVAASSEVYHELTADDLGKCVCESISNSVAKPLPIYLRSKRVEFDHTLIMGILNATPDSFSDGGRYPRKEDAVKRALQMVDEGADIIDLGGESTRPFAEPVGKDEELERVIPILKEVAPSIEVPISIDTMKAEVAHEAIQAGAQIINDVSGLREEAMIQVAAETQVPVILMHMRGDPRTMQTNIRYDDVVGDIGLFFQESIERAISWGVQREKIILDPGLGFGKTLKDNLSIVRRLREFKSLGRPLLIGPSRKGFIGKVLDKPESERLEGTLAVITASILRGASIVRVHDVKEALAAARLADSILNA